MSYVTLSDREKAFALDRPGNRITTTDGMKQPRPMVCPCCNREVGALIGRAGRERCVDCDLLDRKIPDAADRRRAARAAEEE